MNLSELKGLHELSGVEEGDGYILIELDGVFYKATEDPDDGYRSYMEDIQETDEAPNFGFMPIKVVGVMRSDDLIDFYDEINGELVLSIGTENSDDYYPWCVFEWYPEKLHVNLLNNDEA